MERRLWLSEMVILDGLPPAVREVFGRPSRTADIAMHLVMGMHGSRELHVVVLPAG